MQVKHHRERKARVHPHKPLCKSCPRGTQKKAAAGDTIHGSVSRVEIAPERPHVARATAGGPTRNPSRGRSDFCRYTPVVHVTVFAAVVTGEKPACMPTH